MRRVKTDAFERSDLDTLQPPVVVCFYLVLQVQRHLLAGALTRRLLSWKAVRRRALRIARG